MVRNLESRNAENSILFVGKEPPVPFYCGLFALPDTTYVDQVFRRLCSWGRGAGIWLYIHLLPPLIDNDALAGGSRITYNGTNMSSCHIGIAMLVRR